jgi:hypothetical protein
VRVLHYAMGGGLGHLVRAEAFLRAQALTQRAVVLTASRYADDPRITRDFDVLRVPESLQLDLPAYRAWLAARIEALCPDLICVDSFPGGILGELCDFPAFAKVPLWHLARLLRWPEYTKVLAGAPPRYATTWRLEPLDPSHQRYLESCSDAVRDLRLHYSSPGLGEVAIPSGRFWLVVHSDPVEEVAELVAYAAELRAIERAAVRIVVASQSTPIDLPIDCAAIDAFPAAALFPRAERIISAAGFNVVQQAMPYRNKHTIMPFPRRYDDQFARAASVEAARSVIRNPSGKAAGPQRAP